MRTPAKREGEAKAVRHVWNCSPIVFGTGFEWVRPILRLVEELPFADAANGVTVLAKMKTVEAVIEPNGQVRLIEPVHVLSPRRALVTILEEAPTMHDTALLSEAALAEDWNRAEEDAAWAHLQPGKSS